MKKRIWHFLPVVFIVLAGLFAFLYYLTLRTLYLPFELVFVALTSFYFLGTIKPLPLETKEDLFIEGVVLLLLSFSIPGNWSMFWTHFPYTTLFLLLPILCLLLGVIGYIVKLCGYFNKKEATKNIK